MKPRSRRTADLTGKRLGRAVLGYLIIMVATITFSPFRFATSPQHGFTTLWGLTDLLLNIVLFVPLGFVFQLTRPTSASLNGWQALCFGAILSILIETVQLFEATRYSSLMDVAANTLGCWAGAIIVGLVINRINGRNLVYALTLELPLMGLVYLLVPLVWLTGLASDSVLRGWLALPLIAMAGIILGAVNADYLAPTRGFGRVWMFAAGLLWLLIALSPIGIRQPGIVPPSAALMLGSAWLRSVKTGREKSTGVERRFELLTLRQILPLMVIFTIASYLWPFNYQGLSTGPMMVSLFPASIELEKNLVFLALEHVTAFLLLGYIMAEFHGRDIQSLRPLAFRIIALLGGVSLLLEILKGGLLGQGASLFLFALTIGMSVFGAWLYQLQREHICALLVRHRHESRRICKSRRRVFISK